MCFVTSFRMKALSALFCSSLLCFGCNGGVAEPIDEPAPDAANASEVSSPDSSQSGTERPSTASVKENQHSIESHSDSAMVEGSNSELSLPSSKVQGEIQNPLGDRYSGYVPQEVATPQNSLAGSSLLDWSDTNTELPGAAVQPPQTVGSRYPSSEDQVPSLPFDAPLNGEQRHDSESSPPDPPVAE